MNEPRTKRRVCLFDIYLTMTRMMNDISFRKICYKLPVAQNIIYTHSLNKNTTIWVILLVTILQIIQQGLTVVVVIIVKLIITTNVLSSSIYIFFVSDV